MPFGDISVNSKTFNPRQPGTYVKSTVTFGDPTDEFRLRGGSSPSKDGLIRLSVSRVFEKDVTVASVTSRKGAIATLSIAIPNSGFTASEMDVLASDISEFVSATTLTRLLQGEI